MTNSGAKNTNHAKSQKSLSLSVSLYLPICTVYTCVDDHTDQTPTNKHIRCFLHLYFVDRSFYPPAFIKTLQCYEQVHKYLKAVCAEGLMRSFAPHDTRPSVWLLCNEVTWGLFSFAAVSGT